MYKWNNQAWNSSYGTLHAEVVTEDLVCVVTEKRKLEISLPDQESNRVRYRSIVAGENECDYDKGPIKK